MKAIENYDMALLMAPAEFGGDAEDAMVIALAAGLHKRPSRHRQSIISAIKMPLSKRPQKL